MYNCVAWGILVYCILAAISTAISLRYSDSSTLPIQSPGGSVIPPYPHGTRIFCMSKKEAQDDHIELKHLCWGETASSSCENQRIWPCPQNKIWPDQHARTLTCRRLHPEGLRCQLISQHHSHLPAFSGAAPVLCRGPNEPSLLHPARSHYPIPRHGRQQEPMWESRRAECWQSAEYSVLYSTKTFN